MTRLLIAALAGVLLQAPSGWRAVQLQSFDVAWQTIDESFYDPDFGGLDWGGVRDELRPRMEQAESASSARQVIAEMLTRLERSHFGLMSPDTGLPAVGPAVPPFDVRIWGDDVVVTKVHDGDDLHVRPGDTIVAIDGVSASSILAAVEGADGRARGLNGWRRVDNVLRGRRGSELDLRVRAPDGSERDVEVARWLPPGEVVRLGNLPPLRVALDDHEVQSPEGRRIGVIAFNFWMPAIDAPLAEAIDTYREHDGLVLDLRGNPGGLAEMMRGVAGHILEEPLLLGHLRMRLASLQMKANPRRSTPDGRSVEPFAGPVALLVDELTGSTSECFVGALQSLGRARVFGRQTMGQALPALTKRLPSGDVLMYVVGDFVTAAGRSLEGRGVVPDEVVPLSPDLMSAGQDPALEATLAWFDRQMGARN